MINGAHSIIYSTDPSADRRFLKDVLALPHVDVGDGWLIFGLPPGEVAVHPAEASGTTELYFLCESVEAFVAEMRRRSVRCGPVRDQGWGLLTEVSLPSGATIAVYEPRHARPKPAPSRKPAARTRSTTKSRSRRAR